MNNIEQRLAALEDRVLKLEEENRKLRKLFDVGFLVGKILAERARAWAGAERKATKDLDQVLAAAAELGVDLNNTGTAEGSGTR